MMTLRRRRLQTQRAIVRASLTVLKARPASV